jgi:O-antigen/teichoic acid export membrane protein
VIQRYFQNRKHLTDAAFSFFYRILSAGLSFGLYLIIPAVLGAAELGSFSLFSAWLTSLGTIATMGMNILLLRLVSQYSIHSVSKLYAWSITIVIIISGVLAYTAIILGELSQGQWLEKIGLNQWVVLLLIALPFQSILMINVEVIRGMQKVKLSEFLRNLFTHLLTILFMTLFIFIDFLSSAPILGLAISTIISAIVSTSYILMKIYIDRNHNEQKQTVGTGQALATALPMMGSSVLQTWNSRIMVIMLGFFSSKELVGIFSLAFKLSTLPDFVVSALKAPAAPLISKLFWAQQWSELEGLLQSTVRMTAWTAIPSTVMLMLFSYPILSIAGDGFRVGVSTLIILSAAQAAGSLIGLTGAFLNMSNNHTFLLFSAALGLGLNAISAWWLIPHWGIVGAACAYFTGTLVWNGISALYIKHRYNLQTFFNPFYHKKSFKAWL